MGATDGIEGSPQAGNGEKVDKWLTASTSTRRSAAQRVREAEAGQRQDHGPAIPNAMLHMHDGGHVELVASAAEQARLIEAFRKARHLTGEPSRSTTSAGTSRDLLP